VALDPLCFIARNAHPFRPQTFGERAAADRYQHLVGIERQLLVSFGRARNSATIFNFYTSYLRLQVKLDARCSESALEQIGELEVKTQRDPRQKFQHCHFAPESVPN